MISLSAFVICCNERERIPLTIQSLKSVAQEIVVVDSGSTDGTVQYLKDQGINAVYHPWEGYVSQKIYAQSLCTNDWVLTLDADEELSGGLIGEIKSFILQNPEPCAYQINKVFVDPITENLNPYNPKMKFILLYHKSVADYESGSLYKDSVQMRLPGSKPNKFKHPIWHRSKISIHQLLTKMNGYTDLQAQEIVSKGRLVSPLRSLLEIPFVFLKYYLLRRYFLLGRSGFHDSVFWAFARFIKQAKAWEYKASIKK